MKKIKVLHVTQGVIGGTLEYLKLIFQSYDKEKYHMELACPAYGPMAEEISALGIKVHIIDMKREISPFHDLRAFLRLRNCIKKVKPDIMHLHSSKAGMLGRFAAFTKGIPCIYNAHGWPMDMNISNKKKLFYAVLERAAAGITDKIVNISENEHRLALKYNIARESKMITINNGIDVKKYSNKFSRKEVLTALGIPEDAYVIGSVGRLSNQKRPELFIEIAKELSNTIENCYFIMVGDGELRGNVESLIHNYGLSERFRITGWTNEVPKYISAFDVGMLTSKWEGFGLVLAEYMAGGVPVVAAKVGGVPNVVEHNYNGMLVDADRPQSFANEVITIKEYAQFRKYLIENGLKVVNEKFNINRVIDEHERLYEEIYDNVWLFGASKMLNS